MLDELRSVELAHHVKSRAKTPFDNAYRAALATSGATYVQGFVVLAGASPQLKEHAWIEEGDRLLDPSLPHLHHPAESLHYFSAQRLSVKQLKSAVEEAKEDYPEDDPLPIYGGQPYDYYGDVLLGGEEYTAAFNAAQALCQS